MKHTTSKTLRLNSGMYTITVKIIITYYSDHNHLF